ncbi:hypothetical protein [Bradyrhizobium sp. USDA 3315]
MVRGASPDIRLAARKEHAFALVAALNRSLRPRYAES